MIMWLWWQYHHHHHHAQDQETELVPRVRGLRDPAHHAVAASKQDGYTNTKEGNILQVMDRWGSANVSGDRESRDNIYNALHFQGTWSSQEEGNLGKQSLQSVQDTQLNSVQDCEKGGNRACSAIQCSGHHLESGELIVCVLTSDTDLWPQDDLNTALEAIRGGMPVQKAAAEFGIPSGTLYGRCKKVGIELSKNTQVSVMWDMMCPMCLLTTTQVHWSEDDMNLALDSVRTGNMSINQVTRYECHMLWRTGRRV